MAISPWTSRQPTRLRPGNEASREQQQTMNQQLNRMTKTSCRVAFVVALFAFTATSIVGAQGNGPNSGQRITPKIR